MGDQQLDMGVPTKQARTQNACAPTTARARLAFGVALSVGQHEWCCHFSVPLRRAERFQTSRLITSWAARQCQSDIVNMMASEEPELSPRCRASDATTPIHFSALMFSVFIADGRQHDQ
jgi:hypothetical protein